MRNLIIVGAGGHATVVLAAAENYLMVGWVTPDYPAGELLNGFRVLGPDAVLKSRQESGHVAIGDNLLRRLIVASSGPRDWSSIISPFAQIIGETTEIGDGAFVGARAVIQPRVRVGRHAIVNTGAILEHDCLVGEFAHVAPGAILCGGVSVGEGALVGAGAVVLPGVSIGANAVVGAGAVVVADVPDGVTVVGNPARPLER